MKKKVIPFILLVLLFTGVLSVFVPNESQAAITNSDIVGRTFYIKNVYTGQYMDVAGGIGESGRNVQQYKFNGTDAQKWYIERNSDGTYSIYSKLGSNNSLALDISGGSNEDYANVQIYESNGTDAQKFLLQISNDKVWFVIKTKISDYTKAIVLNGPTCDQGRNIDQYTFQSHLNELWILEPVYRNTNMGVTYAQANYDHYLSPYPDATGIGGDCTNFASQCMLAEGIHYNDTWMVYRKNNNYPAPNNTDELDNSWELKKYNLLFGSPWLSAKYFAQYWKSRASSYVAYKGSDILNNPSLAWNFYAGKGDIIQYADPTSSGTLGDARHTMVITDYAQYNGANTYVLTYHTSPTLAKTLLEVCEQYPNYYYIIYSI